MFPQIITYANIGYKDFAINLILNWKERSKRLQLTFYCLDEELYNLLSDYIVKDGSISLKKWSVLDISKRFEAYGSSEYNKITHTKISVLKDALETHECIHFIDADVVLINEPSEEYWDKYLEKHDIIFQNDAPHPNPLFHLWSCTGNITLKHTEKVNKFLEDIVSYQNKHPGKNDQECMYQMLQDRGYTDLRQVKEVDLYQYPMEEFTCGHMLKANLYTVNDIISRTYFFHANHVCGNAPKVQLLKAINKWYV